MPKTRLGGWVRGLLVAFLLLLSALIIEGRLLKMRPGAPLILVVGIGLMIAGVAAFVVALVSLVKFKDRSFIVIAGAIIGFAVTLVVVMELLEMITSSQ